MIDFRLIRHLWLFMAVAEEQHFGRAAARLGMSQPPLTEQIQVLEQGLGVKLFERNRRGAQLTPVGAAILPAVRRFADQLEGVEFSVREAIAGKTGVLTIGAIAPAMLDVLPSLLKRLRTAQPTLTFSVKEIDSADAIPRLRAGELDLAFVRMDGVREDGIEALPLTEEHLAVALPSSHRLATRSRIPIAALASEDFVMFSRQNSPIYFDTLMAVCRTAGFAPRIVHQVRSVTSQIAFVGCGQGIALVSAATKKLVAENVVVRSLKEKISVVTTSVVWNSRRPNLLVQMAIKELR